MQEIISVYKNINKNLISNIFRFKLYQISDDEIHFIGKHRDMLDKLWVTSKFFTRAAPIYSK